MVALAPHLVHPLPLVVAAFDGQRPDRIVGMGLNLYDVMARRALRGRRPRRFRTSEAEPAEWSPDRHRIIDGDEVDRLIPALERARADRRLPLLRLPDRRQPPRPHRPRRGRALRHGHGQRLSRSPSWSRRTAAPRACSVRDAETGDEFDDPRRQRHQRDRRLGRPPAPRGAARRGRGPERSARAAAPTSRSRARTSRSSPARSSPPAAAARSSRCRGSAARSSARPTTTTTATSLDHIPPSEDDVDYLLEATNAFFGTTSSPGDITGAYAGVRPLISTGDPKKSVDISRKAELYETLERDDHDHRRQADDLAADGQARRRPAGRARQPRRAVPHARDPARPRGRRPRSCRASRASPRTPTRRSPAATATPPTTSCASPPSAASWPSRSSPACPTCSPRRPSPPASEQAPASPTSCCAAPAWACSPPASCSTTTPQPVRRVAEAARARARLGRRAASTPRSTRFARRRRPPRASSSPADRRLTCATFAHATVFGHGPSHVPGAVPLPMRRPILAVLLAAPGRCPGAAQRRLLPRRGRSTARAPTSSRSATSTSPATAAARVVYVKRDGGVDARLRQPPGRRRVRSRPSASTTASAPARRASRSSPRPTAAASRSPASTTARCSRWSRPSDAPGFAAPALVAEGGVANPSIDMSINGATYVSYTQSGDVRVARADARHAAVHAACRRRSTSTPPATPAPASEGARASPSRPTAPRSSSGARTAPTAARTSTRRRLFELRLSTAPQDLTLNEFDGAAAPATPTRPRSTSRTTRATPRSPSARTRRAAPRVVMRRLRRLAVRPARRRRRRRGRASAGAIDLTGRGEGLVAAGDWRPTRSSAARSSTTSSTALHARRRRQRRSTRGRSPRVGENEDGASLVRRAPAPTTPRSARAYFDGVEQPQARGRQVALATPRSAPVDADARPRRGLQPRRRRRRRLRPGQRRPTAGSSPRSTTSRRAASPAHDTARHAPARALRWAPSLNLFGGRPLPVLVDGRPIAETDRARELPSRPARSATASTAGRVVAIDRRGQQTAHAARACCASTTRRRAAHRRCARAAACVTRHAPTGGDPQRRAAERA